MLTPMLRSEHFLQAEKIFYISSAACAILKEHNIVDRQINDLAFYRDHPFVRDHKRFFDVVVLVLDKGVQSAVNSVVFAGLYLNGDSGKTVVIID
jgi:hypothetical protein